MMGFKASLPLAVLGLLTVLLGGVLCKDIQRNNNSAVDVSWHHGDHGHHFHGISTNDPAPAVGPNPKQFSVRKFINIHYYEVEGQKKVQGQPGARQFAAVWLVGNDWETFPYYPNKPGSPNKPDINANNVFSPPTIPGQNYIVAKPKNAHYHSEQVILEEVRRGALTTFKTPPERVVMYSYLLACESCAKKYIAPIKEAIERKLRKPVPFFFVWSVKYPQNITPQGKQGTEKTLRDKDITVVHYPF